MFEESSVVAGIPVSSANTTTGHNLWQTLQQKQLEFVPEVQKCLHELAAQSASTEMHDEQQEGVLVSTRRKALLEDILYYWAVAEAYLADASIQASFRQAVPWCCACTHSAYRAMCSNVCYVWCNMQLSYNEPLAFVTSRESCIIHHN